MRQDKDAIAPETLLRHRQLIEMGWRAHAVLDQADDQDPKRVAEDVLLLIENTHKLESLWKSLLKNHIEDMS